MLSECIDHLENASDDQAASMFIRRNGNKHLLDSWTEFSNKAYRDSWAEIIKKNDRERKETLPSQKKKENHHEHQAKSGLNKRQRQVRRYMKVLAHEERTCLVSSLERLRDTGKLYESSDSESEGDSTK